MSISTIEAKLIEWPFYVRHSLNEDHVLYLAELYEQGINLPPITVVKNKTVYTGIDGRHRYYAQVNLLEREKISVNIIPASKKESDLVFDAFKSNLGGPLPPTREDIKHTIELMMTVSSREEIYKYFCPQYYDRATIRRYMDDIISNKYHQLITGAKRAVLEGNLSVPKAATEFKIKEEDLRLALGGIKKGYQRSKMDDIKRRFTYIARSASHNYQSGITQMINNYENGDCTAQDVINMIRTVDKYSRRIHKSTVEWLNRFQTLVETKTKLEKKLKTT